MARVPFNKPFLTGEEAENIRQSLATGHTAGDGSFTGKCHNFLKDELDISGALLTHSCTSALEMAIILSEIGPGDEVIMPSFTFVSTANAVVLRGGVPVFVDIRPDTLNLDERLIESAITSRTKAILPVHYAGVSCAMDEILEIARSYRLKVIEDAAQGYQSFYKGKPLGTLGDFGTLSFHHTKNIISGEGGALLIRDLENVRRAEIIREKGTDRSQYLRGEVDKYSWRDVGSSYLPSDIVAAFLFAQLNQAETITQRRQSLWNRYYQAFKVFEGESQIKLPSVPKECEHNGHIFYLIFPNSEKAVQFMAHMEEYGIKSITHYVPLHDSVGGRKFGRTPFPVPQTENVSERLVRLPLWVGLEDDIGFVIETASRFLRQILPEKLQFARKDQEAVECTP